MVNKLTEKTGLQFNVNTVKASMVQYFKSQGDGEGNGDDKEDKKEKLVCPKFSGSQVAVTAALQELCKLLLNECMAHVVKDQSGMRMLRRSTFRYAIHMNNDLKNYYEMKLEIFDKKQMYQDQVPVVKKEMMNVINNVDKELKLTPKAYNFLNFLLLQAYLDMLATSFRFINFANRKSLDDRSIKFAIQDKFEDNVTFQLLKEIDRAIKASGDDVLEDKDDDEEEVNLEEEEENEEEKPKKGSKSKNVKKSKPEELSEEEEEELKDESEEEVVEVQAKKKVTGVKSKKASK